MFTLCCNLLIKCGLLCVKLCTKKFEFFPFDVCYHLHKTRSMTRTVELYILHKTQSWPYLLIFP